MNTYTHHNKVKVIKVVLVYEIKAYGEWRLASFIISALFGGLLVRFTHRPLYLGKRVPETH
jgi:hypothetical protein